MHKGMAQRTGCLEHKAWIAKRGSSGATASNGNVMENPNAGTMSIVILDREVPLARIQKTT